MRRGALCWPPVLCGRAGTYDPVWHPGHFTTSNKWQTFLAAGRRRETDYVSVVNPLPIFLAAITAADPQPSLRAQVTIRLTQVLDRQTRTFCPADCPNDTDRADALAKVLRGMRNSTSTTQWLMGSSGPYATAWY